MKTLQSTLLLLLFVPLIKPAPPKQQDSHIIYDYGTDNFEETVFTQDYEDKYLDGKNIKVPFFSTLYLNSKISSPFKCMFLFSLNVSEKGTEKSL